MNIYEHRQYLCSRCGLAMQYVRTEIGMRLQHANVPGYCPEPLDLLYLFPGEELALTPDVQTK